MSEVRPRVSLRLLFLGKYMYDLLHPLLNDFEDPLNHTIHIRSYRSKGAGSRINGALK